MDENLAECRERYGESPPAAVLLLQRRGLLGERQRQVVAVLNQRDVCLVVANDAEHILCMDRRSEIFRLTKRGHRFFHAPALNKYPARERVQQREVPAVASGMKSRSGLGDVLANDSDVANLVVAKAELEMSEADGFGIVRLLSVAQRTPQERDRAGLIALGKGDAAVKPPECREQSGRKIVARRVRGPSQHTGGLGDIVAYQPGLGERAFQREHVLMLEPRRLERLHEHGNGVGVPAAFHGRFRTGQRRLKGDRDHRGEYTTGKIG